jgi:hypothetical protein
LEFFKEGKIAFGPFQIQISLKIWIKSETVLFFGPGPLVSLAPHLLAPGPCVRVTTSLQAMVHPSVARPHIGPPVSSLQVVAVVPLASLHPCSAAQLPALKSSPPHVVHAIPSDYPAPSTHFPFFLPPRREHRSTILVVCLGPPPPRRSVTPQLRPSRQMTTRRPPVAP